MIGDTSVDGLLTYIKGILPTNSFAQLGLMSAIYSFNGYSVL